MSNATHIAFADESSHNTGRYRGIGMVSFPGERLDFLLTRLNELVKASNVSEIKWKKIKTAKYRFAALKAIDLIINEAVSGCLRVDVLIWDTEDSRHKIIGRDDNENFRWMYFQLFRNALSRRWPPRCSWELYPDQNSIIDWRRIHYRLQTASQYVEIENEKYIIVRPRTIFEAPHEEELLADRIRAFSVLSILEVNSTNTLLAQVADLFAGIGVFSHQHYDVYRDWKIKNSDQLILGLFEGLKENFSPKEEEHCSVLSYLYSRCKRNKMTVSLDSNKGLYTRTPSKPINFWLYQPQGNYDKAPMRKK